MPPAAPVAHVAVSSTHGWLMPLRKWETLSHAQSLGRAKTEENDQEATGTRQLFGPCTQSSGLS